MICYKKYIQVLAILKQKKYIIGGNDEIDSTEDKASAICELFDEKQIAERKAIDDVLNNTDFHKPCEHSTSPFGTQCTKCGFKFYEKVGSTIEKVSSQHEKISKQ